jgi:adenylosuccinate lyase
MIERYSRPQMKKVWSDDSKYKKWLNVEIAVCEAWSELGVIPREAIPKIKLARINHKRMAEILKETHHDMTAFIGSISESLGPESRFIHLGLTSSDVMDTALSLQLVEAADILDKDIAELIEVLALKAIRHKYTVIMGRTHGIHAEPTSFGLKMALWVEEMRRNRRRLAEAKNIITVGKISGAVGTYATLSPELEEKACAKLKLAPAPISNQVLQRDRHAQFSATLAIIAGSLEKFATEIRNLQRTETREVEEPFAAGQTGSSAMPHKRNPELCERVCGIARLMRGYAMTALENMALWHERDISHSSTERIILPDGCLVLDYAFAIFTSVMRDLNIYKQKMADDLQITHGLIFSQRVMLTLIDKGLSRDQAYKTTQRLAMKSWKEAKSFKKLLLDDRDISAWISPEEIEGLFDTAYYLRHTDEVFQRLGLTESQWPDSANLSNTEELSADHRSYGTG